MPTAGGVRCPFFFLTSSVYRFRLRSTERLSVTTIWRPLPSLPCFLHAPKAPFIRTVLMIPGFLVWTATPYTRLARDLPSVLFPSHHSAFFFLSSMQKNPPARCLLNVLATLRKVLLGGARFINSLISFRLVLSFFSLMLHWKACLRTSSP